MSSWSRAQVQVRPLCHTGTCARIWSRAGEVSYVPFHHCTSQQASSSPGPHLMQTAHCCGGRYILGNTMMIQPIVALCQSPCGHPCRILDMWCEPSRVCLQVVIPRFQLVRSCPPQEGGVVTLPLELAPSHNHHSGPEVLAHPNISVLRKPSPSICS